MREWEVLLLLLLLLLLWLSLHQAVISRVVVGIFPAVKLPPWWTVPEIWRFTAIFW